MKTDLLTDVFDLKMVTKSSINCKGKEKESISCIKADAPLKQTLGSKNPPNLGMWCE